MMLLKSSWLAVWFLVLQTGAGELTPCPDSPNCVNTYQQDEKHEPMEPLSYEGLTTEVAMDSLISMIDDMSRTELVEQNDVYAHFTFKIAVFGFIDDVEFKADTVNRIIHFRSASRSGYYDLGVNKRRMEEIQQLWTGNN